jgi:hypothetical protein
VALDEQPPPLVSRDIAALFAPDQPAYYFMIWARDGTVLARSANAPAYSNALQA